MAPPKQKRRRRGAPPPPVAVVPLGTGAGRDVSSTSQEEDAPDWDQIFREYYDRSGPQSGVLVVREVRRQRRSRRWQMSPLRPVFSADSDLSFRCQVSNISTTRPDADGVMHAIVAFTFEPVPGHDDGDEPIDCRDYGGEES